MNAKSQDFENHGADSLYEADSLSSAKALFALASDSLFGRPGSLSRPASVKASETYSDRSGVSNAFVDEAVLLGQLLSSSLRIPIPSNQAVGAFQELIKNRHHSKPMHGVEGSADSMIMFAAFKPADGPENPTQEHPFNRLDRLFEAGKLDEICDLLKAETNRELLLYGLDALIEADPSGARIADLASQKTPAGMMALNHALKSPPDAAMTKVIADRIKDGSITEAILARNFDAARLLQPGTDGKKLFAELVATIANNPDKVAKLSQAIVKVDLGQSRPPRDKAAADALDQKKLALADMQTEANKTFKEQPSSIVRNHLFQAARSGNREAADQLEKIWKGEAGYDRAHDSAKTVPETAILAFHRKVTLIASEHGLTAEASAEYERTKTRFQSFGLDAAKALKPTRGTSPIHNEAYLCCASGESKFLDSPDAMRKALADKPELLERYEALLKAKPEFDRTQKQVDKVLALLKPAITEMTAAAGLPPIRELKTNTDGDHGAYRPAGEMAVNSAYLTKTRLQTSEFVNTVVHEVAHLEQDSFKLKYLMQQAGVQKGQPVTDAQFQELSKNYKEINGTALSKTFLNEVMANWDGKPMSPAAETRAERLIVGDALSTNRATYIENHQRSAASLCRIADRVVDESGMQALKDEIAKHGVEATREMLALYAGAGIDNTKILESFDKLAAAIERGDDFNSDKSKELRRKFYKACYDGRTAIILKLNGLYASSFEEVDAFRQGDRAAEIIEKSKAQAEAPSMSREKVDLLIARLQPKLKEGSTTVLTDLSQGCGRFFQSEHPTNKELKLAITNTSIVSDANLKAGESKLVMLDGAGKPFEATQFYFDTNGARPIGYFRTATGESVPLSGTRFQIRIGKGTDISVSVAETAVRMQEIVNRTNPNVDVSTAAVRNRETQSQQNLRNLFATARAENGLAAAPNGTSSAETSLDNKSSTATIEAPDGRRLSVKITENGVEINGAKQTYIELVDRSLDKALKELAELEKVDTSAAKRAEIAKRISDLVSLRARLQLGDTTALADLQAALSREVKENGSTRKASQPPHGGRKTAYLMVGSFVAALIFDAHQKPTQSGSLFPPLVLN